MSRRKNTPTQRLAVPIERRLLSWHLGPSSSAPVANPCRRDEHAILRAAVDTLARATEALEAKTTTLQRLRHLIFGPRTETTDKVLGKDAPAGVAPPDTGTDPGSAGEAADSGDTPAAGAIRGLLAAILVALYLVPVLYTLVSAGTQDRGQAAG